MEYQVSKNLGVLLEQNQHLVEIEFKALASQTIIFFEQDEQQIIKPHLSRVSGSMPYGTLYRHLHDCVASDSVVRDVITIGHLAKILSRFDVLMETSDPRVIGLPHFIFDKRSQTERMEFFAGGKNILPIDAGILNGEAVKAMLERERNGE